MSEISQKQSVALRMEARLAVRVVHEAYNTLMLTRLRYGNVWLEHHFWRTQCSWLGPRTRPHDTDPIFDQIVKNLTQMGLFKLKISHYTEILTEADGTLGSPEQLFKRNPELVWILDNQASDRSGNMRFYEFHKGFKFKFPDTDSCPDQYIRDKYLVGGTVSDHNIMKFLENKNALDLSPSI